MWGSLVVGIETLCDTADGRFFFIIIIIIIIIITIWAEWICITGIHQQILAIHNNVGEFIEGFMASIPSFVIRQTGSLFFFSMAAGDGLPDPKPNPFWY